MSMQTNKPKVMHLVNANRLIKKLQHQQQILVFPSFKSITKIVVYNTDASFTNLPDGVLSAGGHMIFLLGEERKACLIMWSSKTIKSTTAAEGLAFAEGLENAIFLQKMLQELLGEKYLSLVLLTARTLLPLSTLQNM